MAGSRARTQTCRQAIRQDTIIIMINYIVRLLYYYYFIQYHCYINIIYYYILYSIIIIIIIIIINYYILSLSPHTWQRPEGISDQLAARAGEAATS